MESEWFWRPRIEWAVETQGNSFDICGLFTLLELVYVRSTIVNQCMVPDQLFNIRRRLNPLLHERLVLGI